MGHGRNSNSSRLTSTSATRSSGGTDGFIICRAPNHRAAAVAARSFLPAQVTRGPSLSARAIHCLLLKAAALMVAAATVSSSASAFCFMD